MGAFIPLWDTNKGKNGQFTRFDDTRFNEIKDLADYPLGL